MTNRQDRSGTAVLVVVAALFAVFAASTGVGWLRIAAIAAMGITCAAIAWQYAARNRG